jgi:hypothetical protein
MPMCMRFGRVGFITNLFAALAAPCTISAQTIHCDILRTSAASYAGRCTQGNEAIALLVLQPPNSSMSGRWHGTGARVFGEPNDSTKDVVDWAAFSPVAVDVNDGEGLFTWCWCSVVNATIDTEGLHFDADPRRPAPVSLPDLEVLRRARSYLDEPSSWNRRDERTRGISYCPREPVSRTLYCALYDATVAVRGEFYIYTPTNGFVRDAIDALRPNGDYLHPLTDFNNDPSVDFDVMTAMLDDAMRRIGEVVVQRR